MKQDVTVELAGGKRIKFETGRMAKQASGAALTSSGDNVVLATAVASPDPKEGIDFFPPTVDSSSAKGARARRRFLPAARSIAPSARSSPRPSATRLR